MTCLCFKSLPLALFIGGSLFMLANSAEQMPANATTAEVTAKASAEGAPQQLILRGVSFPPDAIGARVFLNPKPNDSFTPDSKSYVNSFFASHPRTDGSTRGDFALTLHTPVAGVVRVVIKPIGAGEGTAPGKVEFKVVEIKPVSNSTLK